MSAASDPIRKLRGKFGDALLLEYRDTVRLTVLKRSLHLF
jgi:hypothetical protein